MESMGIDKNLKISQVAVASVCWHASCLHARADFNDRSNTSSNAVYKSIMAPKILHVAHA